LTINGRFLFNNNGCLLFGLEANCSLFRQTFILSGLSAIIRYTSRLKGFLETSCGAPYYSNVKRKELIGMLMMEKADILTVVFFGTEVG